MLDKILNSFGKILKFFGVMIGLIVIGSIIASIYGISTAVKSNHQSTLPSTPTVKQISGNIENNTNNQQTEQIKEEISVKINSIKGDKYNDISETYGQAVFVVEIDNKSDKTIRALSGVITVKDVFGEVVKKMSYQMDEDIAPGKSTNEVYIKLNLFNQNDQKLITLSKFSSTFEPEQIFVD